MEASDPQDYRNTNWWITSLAISIVCCAILFVIFAGYLVDVKENLAVSRMRSDMMEQRLNTMTTEMENLYRRSSVQQIQLIPAGASVQVPVQPSAPEAPAKH